MAEKEYIEREAAINVVVNNPYRIAFKTGKTIQEIKEIPTADVVPKSEVDAIISAVDGLIYLHFNGTYSDNDLYGFFAELKKKYTENKE